MDIIEINATSKTPEVHFDGNKGFFSISGKSYPENVKAFYDRLIDYLKKYKENPAENTVLEFNWLYYNTSTSKMIIELILLSEDISGNVELRWVAEKDFDLMIQKGEELNEILDLDMKIVIK